MNDNFLNQRLITTRKFAPQQADKKSISAGTVKTGDAGSASDEELETLQQIEQDVVKKEAVTAAWKELCRHRRELLESLTDAAAELEQQQRVLDATKAELQERKQILKQLHISEASTPGLAEVRKIKQEIQRAHLELVKYERERLPAEHDRHALLSLSFGQLTRLGLGLTWPLMLALMMAAASLTIAVALAFGF